MSKLWRQCMRSQWCLSKLTIWKYTTWSNNYVKVTSHRDITMWGYRDINMRDHSDVTVDSQCENRQNDIIIMSQWRHIEISTCEGIAISICEIAVISQYAHNQSLHRHYGGRFASSSSCQLSVVSYYLELQSRVGVNFSYLLFDVLLV